MRSCNSWLTGPALALRRVRQPPQVTNGRGRAPGAPPTTTVPPKCPCHTHLLLEHRIMQATQPTLCSPNDVVALRCHGGCYLLPVLDMQLLVQLASICGMLGQKAAFSPRFSCPASSHEEDGCPLNSLANHQENVLDLHINKYLSRKKAIFLEQSPVPRGNSRAMIATVGSFGRKGRI